MTTTPIRDQEILNSLEPLAAERKLALAVSGGADSVALMRFAHRWQSLVGPDAPRVVVLTVDHGLRAESGFEAAWVGRAAKALGFEHAILAWKGAKPASGLQTAARRARYDLLSGYAQAREIGCLVTAHHLDDQAETLLMRLGRGSGVDGLAAIPRHGLWAGVRLFRPLLDFPKARLIASLEAAGQTWLEDPSNSSQDFERNRIRQVLDQLEGFGFARDRLALTARRMRRAQEALDSAAERFLSEAAKLDQTGLVTLDLAAFRTAPEETALRGLGRALMAVGGLPEAPRLNRLEVLFGALRSDDGRPRTLAGCRIVPGNGQIGLWREAGRGGLPEFRLAPGGFGLWDRRFRVRAADGHDALTVRALGTRGFAELRRQLDDRPAMPSDVASGLVSFWRDRELIAVPHLGFQADRFGAESAAPSACSAEFVNGALLGPDFGRRFHADCTI